MGSSLEASQHFIRLFQRKPRIELEPRTPSDTFPELNQLAFDHVRFSYPTRPTINVLKNLNLKLKTGQSIALVGEYMYLLCIGLLHIHKDIIAIERVSIQLTMRNMREAIEIRRQRQV